MIKLHIPGPGVLAITIDNDPVVLLSLQDLVTREVILESAIPVPIVEDKPPLTGLINVPREDSDGREY